MKKRIAIVLCITLIFTNIAAYAAETSKFVLIPNPLTNAGALTDDEDYRYIIDIDLEGDGDRDFIAYYDEDGYDDELASNKYDGEYEFFVNDGNGGFSRSVPNVSLPLINGSEYLCADFDNDGDEDIFAPGSYFKNDGDGNFTSATNPLISAGSLTDAVSHRYIIDIDLEGDGDRDFIAYYDADGYDDELATNTYGGNFIFFINDGNGGFSRSVPNVSLPLINGSEYLCADFDNDGDEDIFAPGSYFKNDGDGNFTSATNPLISAGATTDGSNKRFILDGDLDTDGDVDFLSYDGSAYCFFYNDGSGGFSKSVPSVSLPLKNGSEYLCTDFDNDGDDDVFAPTGYFTQGGSAAGTDNKPPKITTTTPANNATGISGDTNIVLNFDESVTTSGDGNIIIYKASDDSVVETIPGNSTKVTGSGSSSITIDPEITLADSTSFYILIEPKAVLDIDGMSMWIKDNTTLKFTTGTSADPLTGTAIIDNSSPTYGDILTGSIADGHNGTGAATYVWYRDNSVIDGATSATYNVKKDDVGKVLKFGVSYADQTGELTTSTSAVEKKSITIKDVTATNRQYDGTTEVALSNGALQDIGSDTVTFTLGTGTVSSASVGTDKAVTTNITLGGADAGAYTLIQPIDVTVSIGKKLLSINTVTVNDKAYDGTTTATANGVTFTGLENSEILVLDTDFTIDTLNFVDANVENNKTVTGTLSLSSTPKADNYVLSSGDILTTGNIVKADTLIATDPSTLEFVEGIGGSDTFDLDTIGLNKADAGTLSYSLGTLTDVDSIFTTIPSINGSELSFNIKSSATEGQTATQEIVISSDKYDDITVTITFDIINKTQVTISGITVSDKVYDGNVLTYSGVPSYSPAGYDGIGLEYNWSVQGGSSLGSAPTDVGDYTLTIKIPDSNSLYSGEITHNVSIMKKDISVESVLVDNKTYDADTDANVTSVTFTGLASGESLVLDTDYTVSSADFTNKNAGAAKSVTGTVTLVPTSLSDNYTLSDGTFSSTANIIQKVISTNTVTVNDKAYDGTTTATAKGVTFTGLENSETLVLDTDFTIDTLNFVDANVENNKTVTGTLSLSSTPKADNYVLSSGDISTTGNIVKAGTLIATDPSTLEFVEGIGGSDTFDLDTIGLNKADAGTLSYSLGTLTDIDSIFTTIPSINGSELSFNIKSSATEGQTATQEIVISSDKYDDITVTITFDIINKTPVTISGITVSDKVYDGNVLTYSGVPSYSPVGYDGTGLEYNWSVQGGSSLGSAPTDVGDYTLTIKIPDSNSLYSGEITHNVSIMKKDISVESVLVDNKTYDADTDANVTSVTFTGLASGESLVLDTDYTVSSADFTNKNAGTAKSVTGTVTLVATSLSDNYTLSDGTFSSTANIIQKVISTNTVTVNDKAYDGTTTATAKGVTFTGLENSETLVLDTDFTIDTLNFVDANVENNKAVTGTLSLSSTPKADNYVLSSGDISTTGNIVKAGTLIATDPSTLEFVEGIGGSDTFDLDTIGLNKADAGTLSYSLGALTDVDSIFTTIPSINGSELSFNIKSSTTEGQTATQEIVISSDKYDDTTVTITFEIKQLKTNTIMFVTNSDSEIAEITVTSGSAITAPTNPTKSGYTFKGWYRDSGLTKLWDFNSEVTEDMTLYAKWNKRSSSSSSSSDQPSSPTEIIIGDVEGDNVKGDIEKKDERLDVIVDKDSLDDAIDESDEGAVLNIDTMSDTEETNVTFTVNDIEKMAAKGLVISVETEKAIYALPTNDINIDVVKDVFGEEVDTTEIAFKVTQKETSLLMEKVINDIAEDNEIEILMPSIDFELIASYGGKSVAIKSFNSYVTRKIALPEDINLSKVTTATITKEDGTIYHVPTYIEEIDGIYYAVVNSLTNSTYTLIYNEKNFVDIDMWAKSSIENMANRLVMDGDTDITFNPYRDITRAEFTEAVVKALGLAPVDYVEYIDVDTNEEYAGYIQTASEYGIINGIGGERFAPDARITRQDAMVILYRISSIMDYAGNEYNIDLNKYEDYADVSDYAKLAVTWNVNCSMVVGKSETILDPKANITKAEAAIVIEKILKKSGLID